MRKTFLILIPLLIWLAGCGEEPAVHSAPPQPAIAVNVVTAAVQQWPSLYEATGTVRARTSAVISAKWMGYVRAVKVQLGDRVRPGQLLATLDARDLDASSRGAEAARDEVRSAIPEGDGAVAGAKANLDLAEVTFERMNELYTKKSISNQEFDEASAKLKSAQSAYDIARAKRAQLDAKLAQANQEVRASEVRRGYAELQAPFAGVVTAKSIEPGDIAMPGAPLFTVEGQGYRLEAAVEESRLPSIRSGQPVSVKLDGSESTFDARVSEIVPAVDAASRAYTVKVDLPGSPSLRSGIYGRAVFQLGARSLVEIPSDAVSEHGQLQSVFVVENGMARTRLITLGQKATSQVEVLSGLSAGERVICPVPEGLADGTRVEVKQ